MAGDSHILFQPITALTAVGPYRSLASRQAIVWTYRPGLEVPIIFPILLANKFFLHLDDREKRNRFVYIDITQQRDNYTNNEKVQ